MSIAESVEKHRFLILLAVLALLLSAYPASQAGEGAGLVFRACFELVLLAGLVAMRETRVWFWVGIALAVTAATSFWGAVVWPQSSLWGAFAVQSASNFAMALYLLLLIAFTLRDLFSGSHVTANRLCGALSVYLLLGVAWGFIYAGLELHVPGALQVSDGALGATSSQRLGGLLYFSFVTLTTLGYGDVTPATPLAQMVAMWEAIVGQAYLTIIVARLVGLHLANTPAFRGISHPRISPELHRD